MELTCISLTNDIYNFPLHSQKQISHFFVNYNVVIAKSNRIVLVFMALLMLMTSTVGAIDMHFCKGQLKGVSIFGAEESCHKVETTACCMHATSCEAPIIEKDLNCCSDLSIAVAQDTIDKVLPSQVDVWSQAVFAVAFVHAYVLEYLPLEQRIVPFLNHTIPILDKDIVVFVQSFLL